MRVTQDERLPSRDKLIENLLFFDWSSEGANINKTFLILLDAYVGSDSCDAAEPDARQEITFHLLILQQTVRNLQQLEQLNLKQTVQ